MTWRAWSVFGVLGLVWGLPYFFIKLALVDLSAADVAWGRVSLGALVLLPIAWHRGALGSLAAHKGAVVAFAFAELIFPFFLISVGERGISSSLAGILVATLPLTLILLSPAFGLREPLGMRRLVGLATGFAGVVVLLGIGSVHGLTAWAGVGCLLLATLGYAIGSIIVQKHLSNIDELGRLPSVSGSPRSCCCPVLFGRLPVTCRRSCPWCPWLCSESSVRRWLCSSTSI